MTNLHQSRLLRWASIFFVLASLSACSLKTIKDQSVAVTGSATISGTLNNETAGGIPYVSVHQQIGDVYESVNRTAVSPDGRFLFHVLPGTYLVSAFVDANGDGEFQADSESSTYVGIENVAPTHLVVAGNSDVELEPMSIRGIVNTPEDVLRRAKIAKAKQNLGKLTNLNDPMFQKDAVSTGVWRPLDYLDQYGGGLMMLQEYDANKTPVLFVHGIFGSAKDFEAVLGAIDQEQFQPWIMQYPSGLALGMVSDYMMTALDEMQARYKFPDIIVIAHSMGGLVTRSFVKKHTESKTNYRLRMVMTINSPLYGMDSAAKGIEYAPIVIPSWRDVASGSKFVRDLHEWRWPTSTPYQLIFSYLPGEEGDGVVPLKSALSLSLQDEAVKIIGFEAQHAGILKESKFIDRFNQTLEEYQ